MKIYVRTAWSDYEEISLKELNERISYYYNTVFVIDEMTEDTIYILQMELNES